VLFGWPHSVERAEVMFRNVWSIAAMGKSMVIVADKGLPSEAQPRRRIDIWWRGQQNGSLIATLAHLLIQNWEWRDSYIRILRVIRDAAGHDSSLQAIRKLVEAARIRAESRVIVSTEPFSDVFRSHSAKADVIFIGMQRSDDETSAQLYSRISDLLTDMPTTILVHSSGEADVFV